MAKKCENWLTDEEVEQEIERLKASDAVKLARKKRNYDFRRRNYLYSLRNLEKEGKDLMEAGITADMLDEMYSGESEEVC